jgi:glyoxylase-like metal-dependent hydrolase (beta-lactamase superfamily II)
VADRSDPDLLYTAAREMWEETGFWLGPEQPPEGGVFADLQATHPPAYGQLAKAGLRTTPAYALIRFRAQFYTWEVPTGQVERVAIGELEGGRWWGVQEALEAWRRGQIYLAAPTQDSLLALAAGQPERLNELPEDTPDPIRVYPGLSYIPLETDTLPPARHTLCFLLGEEKLTLVDPASQFERILAVLGERPVERVIFTHAHPDHVGCLEQCRERGWPIWASPQTATQLGGDFHHLEDGHSLADWKVVFTPGHASGHLSLWNAATQVLIAGDLVSGVSTILVSPPDGDMSDYLQSLQLCIDLKPQLVLPSHGGPFGPGSRLLEDTLAHRLAREAKVWGCLRQQPQTLEEILTQAYADVEGPALQLACHSLRAHLNRLVQLGQACPSENGWSVSDPGYLGLSSLP